MEVDNNQNQTSGATPPQAPPQQPQTSTPQSPSQPSNPQMAPVSTEMPMAAPSGNGNTGKIFAIVAAIIGVIILVAALVWFFIAYWPQAQAKSAANKFVVVTVDGDYDEAFELTNSDADQKQAVVGLIESLDSQLGDSGYKISKFEKVDDTYKITYRLVEDNEKWFRIELNSDLEVSGIYLGIGGTQAIEDTQESIEGDSSAQTSATVGQCITESDIEAGFKDQAYFISESANNPLYLQDNFFFNPDSTSYQYEDQMKDAIARYGEFAQVAQGKSYSIIIIGDVNQDVTDSSGIELANQRSAKAKSDLIAAGVPASNIDVRDPRTGNGDILESANRNVDVILVSTCAGQPEYKVYS